MCVRLESLDRGATIDQDLQCQIKQGDKRGVTYSNAFLMVFYLSHIVFRGYAEYLSLEG